MNAPNTQLTIDLNSVSYCSFYYKNQWGNVRRIKPKKPTRLGQVIPNEFALPLDPAFPSETLIERGRRLELVDIWTPVCRYQFRNNHSMKFTGDKAIAKHKQYQTHIYNK